MPPTGDEHAELKAQAPNYKPVLMEEISMKGSSLQGDIILEKIVFYMYGIVFTV